MGAEVPVNYVAQLSGNRNLKSLDSYKAASVDRQRKMSLILSHSGEQSTQSSSVSSLVQESSTVLVNLPKLLILTRHFNQEISQALASARLKAVLSRLTFTVKKKEAHSPQSPRKRRIIISDDSDSD